MPDGPAWTSTSLEGNPHEDQQKAERVRQMFSAIARSYDLNNRVHSFWQDQRWRREAVRQAGVDAKTRALDAACGTGDLAEAIARAGAASVTGVDFTPEMLEMARLKNPTSRVCYEHGDAMALRFAASTFDVVTIAFGIRNVADPKRALAEFARVLAPGGRLVVLEFSEPSFAPVRAFSNLYTRHIMPRTAAFVARDTAGAYRYLPRSVSTFMSPEQFMALLRTAGFSDVTTRPMALGICRVYRAVRP